MQKTFNRKLDLLNPKTFNEKIQFRKIYDSNPIYSYLSDKYLAREYVRNKIGGKYLIPLILVEDSPSKINFRNIRKPHIIKANHGSAMNIIVFKESHFQEEKIRKQCENWLKEDYYIYGKEMQYKNIDRKIIVEELLLNNKKIPNDYKFHCFNGKVEFIQIDSDRFGKHKRIILDRNWKKMPFLYCPKKDGKPMYEEFNFRKPNKSADLLVVAEKLAKNFDYVRVDLYLIKNTIYFGEFTFTSESGFGCFFPDKYDLFYGEKWR